MTETVDILDYLDDNFFGDIVVNALNIKRDEFKINLVVITPASEKTDNYISVLYRAKIKIVRLEDNTKQTVAVIIKALLTTIPELREFSVFPRERMMYEHVIPSLEQFCRDVGIEIQFGPKSYKFENEPFEIIVLEDMNASGFKMANRMEGLDLDHVKLLMVKLAKFHAASAIFYEKHGDYHKDFVRKYDEEAAKMMEGFKDSQRNFYGNFIEILEKNDFGKPYVETIKSWSADYFDAFFDIGKSIKNGFRVLNHGDLWTNNHLYSYDENGKPDATSLIDFQISHWGSPVSDLLYFYVSSTNNDIRGTKFDEVIEVYHNSLVETLTMLNYPKNIPTLEELHEDILEKSLFGALCLFNILVVCKIDRKEEATIDMFVKTDPETLLQLKRIFNNSVYLESVAAILPFMGKRGMLSQK